MLSGPHRKFAEGIAQGLNQTQAYKAAYPDASAATARRAASALMTNHDIAAEVDRIRAAAEVIAGGAVLTLAMKRKFLHDVVMTPISEIGPDSHLCQEYQRARRVVGRGEDAEEWEVEKYKVPSKTDAVKLDAQLAGELSDKVTVTADDNLMDSLQALLEVIRK